MECLHRDVRPVLPAFVDQQEPWKTSVEAICHDCGADGFVMWEAYGYAEAFREESLPTIEFVLIDFEAWWEQLREYGSRVMALQQPGWPLAE